MNNFITQINPLFIFFAAVLVMTISVNGQTILSKGEKSKYTKVTYTYKTVDSHKIFADVYRMPGEDVRPAIIWVHGGALIFGTRKWLGPEQLEMYLSAGYAVISIDYRLAPETKLEEIIKDLEDSYSWVRSEGPGLFKIDPDRIAFVGHSAGGYLTLLAGFRLNPRPQALVSFYGYGDITGDWYALPDSFYNQGPPVSMDQAYKVVGDSAVSSTTTKFTPNGRFQFYLYCRQQGLWPIKISGHGPHVEREWYAAYEPLRNVTPAYPPTILLHGEKDTDVPFEQSVQMAEALRKKRVDHQFITNPEWGHGFDGAGKKDPAVKEAYEKVLKFLEKYLK
jgi:acetyl esterase/lipase